MRPSFLGPGQKSRDRNSTFAKRGGRLRRRHRRKVDRKAAAAFRTAAARQPACAVCGMPGQFDSHHAVPAQWLRRNRPELEWDERNALRVCRGCHDEHERAHRRIPRRCLTPANLAFISEVGAEWLAGSLYPLHGNVVSQRDHPGGEPA